MTQCGLSTTVRLYMCSFRRIALSTAFDKLLKSAWIVNRKPQAQNNMPLLEFFAVDFELAADWDQSDDIFQIWIVETFKVFWLFSVQLGKTKWMYIYWWMVEPIILVVISTSSISRRLCVSIQDQNFNSNNTTLKMFYTEERWDWHCVIKIYKFIGFMALITHLSRALMA